MKDPQQAADELVEKYREMKVLCAITERTKLPLSLRLEQAIQCAIIDTQNTIDVLNIINCVVEFDDDEDKTKLFNNYQQVLTILKNRL